MQSKVMHKVIYALDDWGLNQPRITQRYTGKLAISTVLLLRNIPTNVLSVCWGLD